MQLQTTSPESKFPNKYIAECLFKSINIWKNYWKKYKGVPILWNTVYNHFTTRWTLYRTTQVSRYQRGKTNLNLLEQEIVKGSGISWAICEYVPHPRQIAMPESHHSVFYRFFTVFYAHPAAQPTASKHCRHCCFIGKWIVSNNTKGLVTFKRCMLVESSDIQGAAK